MNIHIPSKEEVNHNIMFNSSPGSLKGAILSFYKEDKSYPENYPGLEKAMENPEVIMHVVKVSGTLLANFPEEVKNNKEVVLAAVNNTGSALLYASNELKNDKEVVSAAILQDPKALSYASEELQTSLKNPKMSNPEKMIKKLRSVFLKDNQNNNKFTN